MIAARLAIAIAIALFVASILSGCVGCELRDGELKCIEFDSIK